MSTPQFKISYQNNLITKMEHLYSGTEVITDAPLDNFGKASSFSPTDLLSSALASCMISIWAIHYKNLGQHLKPINCEVTKVMASNPRRISEIHLKFDFGENEFKKDDFDKLMRLGMACPVVNSLSNEILILTNFNELLSQLND